MNFEIKKEVLLHFLLQIQKILPTKTFFPVYYNIKIEIQEDVLFLEVINMNIAARLEIKDESLKVKKTGSLIVIGKYFIDIIKKIDSPLIKISSMDNKLLVIKTLPSSEYKLKMMNFNDFPSIDFAFNFEKFFLLKSDFLKKLIKEAVIVTSKDKQKNILTGVNLIYKKPFLTALSTDSFRISQKRIELNLDYPDFNIVIPSKSLEEMNKLLEQQKDENIKIAINEQKLFLCSESLLFQTILLEGNFPLMQQIKEENFSSFVKLKKEDLTKTLERLSLFLPKEENIFNNIVHLNIDQNQKIEIFSGSEEIGNASEEILPLEDKVEENIKTAFNVKHLEEILKVFPTKEIKIHFDNSAKPFIISSEEDKTLLYLILPFL
ncbi:MAG: DNA polymerase III subunit beta ['Conium maculatum' witches'-broom phytoplasma]|nr:DNA polymerase III subunit beta ['Conium maculatum' witches'-broom phytoplasma]